MFDVADTSQSTAAFNPEELQWINQQHIIRKQQRNDSGQPFSSPWALHDEFGQLEVWEQDAIRRTIHSVDGSCGLALG